MPKKSKSPKPQKPTPQKTKPQKAKLKSKPIQWPEDWLERIDQVRGDMSFSDFVRQTVLEKIGRQGLSEMPGWGLGRWKP